MEQWSNVAQFLRKTNQDSTNLVRKFYLEYAFHAGRITKGDILVAHNEKLENLDESEIHARRLNAKEVNTPKTGGNFNFPIVDGTVELSGRDQVFRKSTLIRDQPEKGEERKDDPRGESDGSQLLDT